MERKRGEAGYIGKIDEQGRIIVMISSSKDIARFVREVSGGRSIAEISGVTLEDGLKIDYNGTGNFRLTSPTPEPLRQFLNDKSFRIGSVSHRRGSSFQLPKTP